MPSILLFSIVGLAAVCWGQHASSDVFSVIKERVVAELLKSRIDDRQVEDIVAMMQEDGSFQGIDYADLTRVGGFPHRHHTYNLVHLAKAYHNKASVHFHSEKLKEEITRGVRHWVEKDYVGDNWHDNQITTPSNLVNLMLLIGDDLPEDLVTRCQPMINRAHMGASGARPSGDRIVIAGIVAKNALFLRDNENFEEIIRIIEGEVKFSTGERGMQHDYSFHHRTDRVNNTTSYGYGKYANVFGEWSYYVAGTKYAFSKQKIDHLVNYYLDGVYKQLVYGVYTDVSVKNRSITHEATFEPQGIPEIERLLLSTDYRKDELEEIIQLRRGQAKPTKSFSKFFWQTEHFVVQRPDFYTTVRMFSTRNRNMEIPYNGPGKPTHHRADGTNYVMLNGDEYHNIWPVYDWQKISGTTILQKPKLHPPNIIQKAGLTDFVGAATDGFYGAVGFDFISPHDKVAARKAWFFFEDDYVCLGAGIRSDSELLVVTTINQALLRGDVAVMCAGEQSVLPAGDRKLDAVKWVHHDRIGYLLPKPTTLRISNQTEEGRWSDITDQTFVSDELVQKDVFKLYFDHGRRPSSESYAYIVVPSISDEELATSSTDNRGIEILANSKAIQAVRNTKLGICQFVFYSAGKLEFASDQDVKIDSPGIILLTYQGDRISNVTVADPLRKLPKINVEIPGIYGVSDEGCSASPDDNSTVLEIDLPLGVNAGKSVTIELHASDR
ncbi:polysaccharide lyase family 8 super-sandwich domain-containing protein [Novipirellula artificiosorum]|nr:polysaccharide lyase family 8 super-sandwich domain-containing protein [Novipirellula artificiosorum]